MRRIKIISTAICLAIICAILPMAGALFFAWSLAFQEESNVLYEYTARMLTRAKHTMNKARQALSLLENNKDILPICSPQHIQWMQKVSTSTAGSKKISYFEHGVEYCTSCGSSVTKTPRSKMDFILPDGLEVGMPAQTSAHSRSFIPVRRNGNYDVFVDVRRLADIIIPDGVWLAIAYNGKIITQQNEIRPSLLRIIMDKVKNDNLSQYYYQADGKERLKPAERLKKNQVFILDEQMVFISQYGPFYFISSEPESFVNQHYEELQLILLPFGLITAFFIVGLVIYYSKKRLLLKMIYMKH